jgi:hypothetical protein
MLACLAGVAGSTVSAAEGLSEADAAMGLIRKALEMGYRDLAEIRPEPALESLRSRPDFQLLIMDLGMPVDPFAQAR